MIVAFVWLFFQAAKFAFYAGIFLLPVLLIATYILDKNTLVNYFGKIKDKFSVSFIDGLGNAILKTVLLPFTSFYLLAKAFVVKKYGIGQNNPFQSTNSANEQEQLGEYVEYEEL